MLFGISSPFWSNIATAWVDCWYQRTCYHSSVHLRGKPRASAYIQFGNLSFCTYVLLYHTIKIVPDDDPNIGEHGDEYCQFHPLRDFAKNRPVYSIPLISFIDDVSGNQSKQWNKHFSIYMSNGALPRRKLENEFHVRFVATSPNASPLEMMQGLRGSIEYVTFCQPPRSMLTFIILGVLLLIPLSRGIAKTRKKFYCVHTPFYFLVTIQCRLSCVVVQVWQQTISVKLAK